MQKSIAIVVAAIVVSLAVVAYDAGAAEATIRSGRIGDKLRLRGSEMTYTTADLTVLKMTRVAEENLLGLRLRLKNVRTKYNRYTPCWQERITGSAALLDAHGKKFRLARSATDDSIYNIRLRIGESVTGWVYYQAQPQQKAKTFRFKVNGRFGYDTGRWSLR